MNDILVSEHIFIFLCQSLDLFLFNMLQYIGSGKVMIDSRLDVQICKADENLFRKLAFD